MILKGELRSMVRTAARLTSTVATGAHDSASTLSPVRLPGRRYLVAPAMIFDPEGQDLLDFLGEDTGERAERMEKLLDRCSEEELALLLAAMQEAIYRRSTRARHRRRNGSR